MKMAYGTKGTGQLVEEEKQIQNGAQQGTSRARERKGFQYKLLELGDIQNMQLFS